MTPPASHPTLSPPVTSCNVLYCNFVRALEQGHHKFTLLTPLDIDITNTSRCDEFKTYQG